MHAGKLTRERARGVDAEPLLLPDAHPDQGRDHPVQVGGSGVSARVDPPHPGSRRRRPRRAADWRCGCGWPRRSASIARRWRAAGACCPACASPATLRQPGAATARSSVAVASSLTEMFAPDLMSARIAAWEQHYPWVGAEALAYFRARVPRARRDGEEALAFVVANAHDARAAGGVRRGAGAQDRDSRGTSSTACRPRRQAPRMIGPDSRGCAWPRKARLRFDDRVSGKHMLLYPERGLELSDSAARIVALCGGERGDRPDRRRHRRRAGRRVGRAARAHRERRVKRSCGALADRGLLVVT